jgi:hypothetical protein
MHEDSKAGAAYEGTLQQPGGWREKMGEEEVRRILKQLPEADRESAHAMMKPQKGEAA